MGSAVLLSHAGDALVSAFAAIAAGVDLGAEVPQPCPGGGTVARTCTGTFSSRTQEITLEGCTLATVDGGSLELDGSVSLEGSALCEPSVVLLGAQTLVASVRGEWRASGGGIQRVQVAALEGTVSFEAHPTCTVGAAAGTASGTLDAELPGAVEARLTLADSSVSFLAHAMGADCVPLSYAVTLGGPGTLAATTPFGASGFAGALANLVLAGELSAEGVELEINGDVAAGCFGGTVALDTVQPLRLPPGEACPAAGHWLAMRQGATVQVFHTIGFVEFDANGDGIPDEAYPTCIDSQLVCP